MCIGQHLNPFLQVGRKCVVRPQLLAQGCPLRQQRLVEGDYLPADIRHRGSGLPLGKAYQCSLCQHRQQ
ncbi:TPA: hypothetical protein ACSP2X_004338, partial [Aeromonas veronii]